MRFLIAVDGSPEADDALDYAMEVADAMDASLTVAFAVDPSVFELGGEDPVTRLSDADERLLVEHVADAEDRGLDVLEEAAETATARGHDVDTELLYGDPVEELTDFAAELGYDAIFVGHRGRSNRADVMVGSVAKALVERSTVPVTVVR